MLGLRLSLPLALTQGGRVPSWVPKDEAGTPALLAFGPEFGYWYNGVRYSTWAAFAAAIGSVTVSIDSDGSVRDASGARVSATADVLRYDHDDTGGPLGWLMEGASINRFANPAAPATQTITTRTSNRCAVSMKGAGSLTLSGAATATVTEGTPYYFDAPGSLTVTVTGVVAWVMVDDNPPSRVPTSLITTAGVTRSADVLRFGPNASSLPFPGFAVGAGTIVAWGRTCPYLNGVDQKLLQIDDASAANRIVINRGAGIAAQLYSTSTLRGDIGRAISSNANFAVAIAWANNELAISVDGAAEQTYASGAVPALTTLRLNGNSSGADPWSGWVRKVAYFPRRVPSLSARPFFFSQPDRVYLLGDSFASYGTQLQALLGNRPLTVDGVGGSSLSQQAARWALVPSAHDRILILQDDTSWAGEAWANYDLSAGIDAMLAVYHQITDSLSGGRLLIMSPGRGLGAIGGGVGQATLDAKWAAIAAAYPTKTYNVDARMRAESDGSALDQAMIRPEVDWWPASCLAIPVNPAYSSSAAAAAINAYCDSGTPFPADLFAGADWHCSAKGWGVYAAGAYAAGQSLGYWA